MVVSMGTFRAGIPGGLVSFALWNIPSFIVLTLAGLGVKDLLSDEDPDWLAGVGAAAISLVFVAAYKVWDLVWRVEGNFSCVKVKGKGGTG